MIESVIFLIWAIAPDEVLHKFGITYYPNRLMYKLILLKLLSSLFSFFLYRARYYCVALPAYVLVFVLILNLVYLSINLIRNPAPDAMTTITDNYTNWVPDRLFKIDTKGDLPDMGDIDPARVSFLRIKGAAQLRP